MLTRAEMEKVIKDGGSVMIDGKPVTNVNALPSEAALSKDDEAEQDRLLASYEDQIKSLQAKKQAIFDERQKPAAMPPAAPGDKAAEEARLLAEMEAEEKAKAEQPHAKHKGR